MKKIQYFDILKQALLMTWDNKFLWVFGLLVLLNTLVSNVITNFSDVADKSKQLQAVATLVQNYPHIFLGIVLAGFMMLIVFFLLRLLGTAGIIKSANNINIYKQSTVVAILAETKKYVGVLFLFEIIINAALGVVIVLLFLPVAYLFVLKADILAAVALAIAALIFILLAILASYLRRYAFIYMILENMRIRMALESAYVLLEKNIKESLLMGLVAIVANVAVILIAVVAILTLAMIIIPFGLALYFLLAKTGAVVILTVGAIIGMVVVSVLFSWYAAFAQTIWVLFFQQISLEKQIEKVVLEKREVAEEIVNPEAA